MTRVFSAFRCYPVDMGNGEKRYFLEGDFSIACFESDSVHVQLIVPLAIVALVIYTVGFPAFVVYELWSHRTSLHDHTHDNYMLTQLRVGSLVESFEEQFWCVHVTTKVFHCTLKRPLNFFSSSLSSLSLSLSPCLVFQVLGADHHSIQDDAGGWLVGCRAALPDSAVCGVSYLLRLPSPRAACLPVSECYFCILFIFFGSLFFVVFTNRNFLDLVSDVLHLSFLLLLLLLFFFFFIFFFLFLLQVP